MAALFAGPITLFVALFLAVWARASPFEPFEWLYVRHVRLKGSGCMLNLTCGASPAVYLTSKPLADGIAVSWAGYDRLTCGVHLSHDDDLQVLTLSIADGLYPRCDHSGCTKPMELVRVGSHAVLGRAFAERKVGACARHVFGRFGPDDG